MTAITSSFVITAILGWVLICFGWHFGRRTGKLGYYALILVGIGLITVGLKAWSSFSGLSH